MSVRFRILPCRMLRGGRSGGGWVQKAVAFAPRFGRLWVALGGGAARLRDGGGNLKGRRCHRHRTGFTRTRLQAADTPNMRLSSCPAGRCASAVNGLRGGADLSVNHVGLSKIGVAWLVRGGGFHAHAVDGWVDVILEKELRRKLAEDRQRKQVKSDRRHHRSQCRARFRRRDAHSSLALFPFVGKIFLPSTILACTVRHTCLLRTKRSGPLIQIGVAV